MFIYSVWIPLVFSPILSADVVQHTVHLVYLVQRLLGMSKVFLLLGLVTVVWTVVAEDAAPCPLVITPYLEKNEVDKAKLLARVRPDIGHLVSYSGYFEVNKDKTCGNHLFFWFFPATNNWEKAPVILWLQGGPGASSLYGIFELNGPFNSFADGLKPRNTSWTNFANMIYIDNPVGTGFSFTRNRCYAKTIPTASEELYSALTQFYELFPELKKNNFYLTGESFAGHFLPSLGALIDLKNSEEEVSINMKGIVMGNPNMKQTCHDYATFLYQLGIVDEKLRDELYNKQQSLNNYVNEENYIAAYEVRKDINALINSAGIKNTFSILNQPKSSSTFVEFLNKPEIQNQLHTGAREFKFLSDIVFDNLIPTITEPFSTDVEKLLRTKKYIVAFFSGNLDIRSLVTSSTCIMRSLEWPGQDEYLNANRSLWFVNGELSGWFKTSQNLLLDIVVKDAMHKAIYSKPEATYKMMISIVAAKPGQNPLWALQTSPPEDE